MGHAKIETTMIYTHHTPKIAAADEMSRAVAEAMGADVSRDVTRTERFEQHLSDTATAV